MWLIKNQNDGTCVKDAMLYFIVKSYLLVQGGNVNFDTVLYSKWNLTLYT